VLDPTIEPPHDLIDRIAAVNPTVISQFRQIWAFLMFYVRGAEKWAWIYGNWDFNTPAKSPSEDEKAEKLYTFTAVPRGKGLKHEGRNRYEVYREEQDWIARYLANFEKKIGSYLPDGFKWQNIMTHFHKIGEWAPERWNMINSPSARIGRLDTLVLGEIARWLNERINAIGYSIKRLLVLKEIPESDLQTQKNIIDWYCIGQTCALFLNYEARVWNWLDPQLFIRNDKRPIPLDVAHTLLTEPAKGHLAMRIDPTILLQYYGKFVDAGITDLILPYENKNSVVAAYVTKKAPPVKPAVAIQVSTEKAIYPESQTKRSKDQISEQISMAELIRLITSKLDGNHGKIEPIYLLPFKDQFNFHNSSPPGIELQVSTLPTTNVHNVVVNSQIFSGNESGEELDSPVCFLDGGFINHQRLRCKLVPSANECLIAKEIAQDFALIRPLREPWFVEMKDQPKIECRSHGRLFLHLDEDRRLSLNVFVPEISLGEVDVIIGDSAIMRFGLCEKYGEIFATNFDNGYRSY